MIELTSERPMTGGVRRTGKHDPIVPVSSYGKTRYYLQDGHYIPSWLVWARRRRHVALALLLLVAGALAAARLLLAGRR